MATGEGADAAQVLSAGALHIQLPSPLVGTWSLPASPCDFIGKSGCGSFQATSLEWLLGARDCSTKEVRGWLVGKPALVVTVAVCAAFFLTKTEFRTLVQGYSSVVKYLPRARKAQVQSLALCGGEYFEDIPR